MLVKNFDRPHRVQKDNADIKKVIDGIKKTMNPFVTSAEEPDVNLYCLTTGKQTSEGVRDDLLGCVQKGEAWCAEFKDGSFEDGLRFQKPIISHRKVKNFASDAVKTKLTCKDQKLLELKGTRDLFGRLLYVFDFIECFTTTFLRAHSWLNWVAIAVCKHDGRC